MDRRIKTNRRAGGGSIREKAYVHIQRLVANGTLKAGSCVSELLVAKRLESSRAPIREAMNQLVAEGFLEQNPSGGMIVAQLKREDIVELYELREALEVFAVGKVARGPMPATEKQRLQSLVDEVWDLQKELGKSKQNALNVKQMERFIACDLGFHALLMSMADNSRLQKVLSDTRLLISVFAIHREGHDRASLKSIYRFHQRILDAASSEQAAKAMSVLAEHIQESRRERLNEYDRWKRESSLRQGVTIFVDVHTTGSQA